MRKFHWRTISFLIILATPTLAFGNVNSLFLDARDTLVSEVPNDSRLRLDSIMMDEQGWVLLTNWGRWEKGAVFHDISVVNVAAGQVRFVWHGHANAQNDEFILRQQETYDLASGLIE